MFVWRAYYDLAVELVQHLPQSISAMEKEARWRAAISRAYYAAFCSARNFAQDHDGFKFDPDTVNHVAIWRHFERPDDEIRQQIYITGYRLRGTRRKADYYDNAVINQPTVMKSLAEAGEILTALNKLK